MLLHLVEHGIELLDVEHTLEAQRPAGVARPLGFVDQQTQHLLETGAGGRGSDGLPKLLRGRRARTGIPGSTRSVSASANVRDGMYEGFCLCL